ncbi:hypothetical protein EZV62_028007 [Acer yangbiense]|uniref:F-box domain-containing protein n=1 Tax=Acer yangbiense TaxID=1000413 RepID=A0A5C7GPI2_9ROSI|nr:hypothetical protein EZV62_028007 [Acer yangbiense]
MEMESKKKKRNLHIPDDIIFNILRKLPPKSLARSKCVCKSWQSFANQHKYHNQKLILFSSKTIQSVDFEADEIKAVDLDIPFKVSNRMLGIASCNGLLCILTEREGFVIWNPLIGRYKRVSNTSEYDKFGFWYDHSTDNYKIVRFMRFYDPNSERQRYSAEIYSQKSNSWQQKEILPWQFFCIIDSLFGVLVNETLYWKIFYINNDKKCIPAVLCFDTLNEKFDVIISPDNVRISDDLRVFKGHLCFVQYHKAGHMDMWTREAGKSQNWMKFMNLPPFEGKSLLYHYLVPICSMKEDEIFFCQGQNFERKERTQQRSYAETVKGYQEEGHCSEEKDREKKTAGFEIERLLALRKKIVQNGRNRTSEKENFQICWPKEAGVVVSKLSTPDVAGRSSEGLVKPKVVVLEVDKSPTSDKEEVSLSDGTISKERFRGNEDGELDRNGVAEVFSRNNSVSKEEMVRASIEMEKNLAVGLTEISSEEELVRATSVVKERTGTRLGLCQNSRSKSKVLNSHGMRTRNSIKSGSVEEEAAKTVEIGIALGFEFSEAEDEVMEEITRREKEDIARFEAISG